MPVTSKTAHEERRLVRIDVNECGREFVRREQG